MITAGKTNINKTILFLLVVVVTFILYKDFASIKEDSIMQGESTHLPAGSNKTFISKGISPLPPRSTDSPYWQNESNNLKDFSKLNKFQERIPYRIDDSLLATEQEAVSANNQAIQENNNIDVSDYIKSFIKADSYQENTLNRLGDSLNESGYKQEAVDAYDQAIQENKGDIAASLIAIGDIVTEEGNIEDFFDYSLSVINLHPNDNNLYESIADFFREKGEYQIGLQLLDAGLQYNSENNNYLLFYNSYRAFIDGIN
jgi:tetratricopeptide (TPR) repeat protein